MICLLKTTRLKTKTASGDRFRRLSQFIAWKIKKDWYENGAAPKNYKGSFEPIPDPIYCAKKMF